MNGKLENGVPVLVLDGRITSANAAEVESAAMEFLADKPGSALRIDAEPLEYVSSAGLRVLLSAQKTMNKQGEMKLCNVNDIIQEIFEVTGFVDILTIE